MTDLFVLLLVVSAALFIRRYVLCVVRIRGRSMLPTLRTGQWVLVTRWDYLLGKPQRDDVVICFFPGRMRKRFPFLRQMMIKRVVGLPGEHIAFENGDVLIDGQALQETYLDPLYARRLTTRPPLLLKENEHFVMGDNRDVSHDSRAVGPLDRRMIVGRARLALPFRRIGASRAEK